MTEIVAVGRLIAENGIDREAFTLLDDSMVRELVPSPLGAQLKLISRKRAMQLQESTTSIIVSISKSCRDLPCSHIIV